MMGHRDQSFSKAEVVRAYKAAQAAGIANPRLVIDTMHRTITIIPGEPTKNGAGPADGPATAPTNDLDFELELLRRDMVRVNLKGITKVTAKGGLVRLARRAAASRRSRIAGVYCFLQ